MRQGFERRLRAAFLGGMAAAVLLAMSSAHAVAQDGYGQRPYNNGNYNAPYGQPQDQRYNDRAPWDYQQRGPRREYGLDNNGRQFGSVLALGRYGGEMYPGDQMESNNGEFQFEFQTDGNLVLSSYTGQVLWASGTQGRGGMRLMLQQDGNLVLYGEGGPIWSTHTQGRAYGRGLWLSLQDDGNLVLMSRNRPIWSSRTAGGRRNDD